LFYSPSNTHSNFNFSPDVLFCGYTVPHPAEAKMNLRIQAMGTPAADILKRALTDLSEVCEHVEKTFNVRFYYFIR
jgi:DNA-directed RNA polymerases I and III subunit RPAC2